MLCAQEISATFVGTRCHCTAQLAKRCQHPTSQRPPPSVTETRFRSTSGRDHKGDHRVCDSAIAFLLASSPFPPFCPARAVALEAKMRSANIRSHLISFCRRCHVRTTADDARWWPWNRKAKVAAPRASFDVASAVTSM
ncbi:hypothetical protein MRX96_037675 [Rhipicephalus microplus]